jgi:hypothetical protein
MQAGGRLMSLHRLHIAVVFTALFAPTAYFAFGNSCFGQTAQWGDLSGRFVYDGKPPAPKVQDETLVINGRNKGLANVLVWLRIADVNVHPDYEKTRRETVSIELDSNRFKPRIVLYRTGAPLRIVNTGRVGVDFNFDPVRNSATNRILPANFSVNLDPLELPEAGPIEMSDAIHPNSRGWLLVANTPYAAVSDADGKFEVKNLPSGTELEFQVWQERSGWVNNFQNDRPDRWPRGRFKKTLVVGGNALGDIKLDPKQF